MAIAYQQQAVSGFQATGNTPAFGSTIAVNDLIVTFGDYRSLGGAVSPTVSDNVNTGNYTIIRNDFYASGWSTAAAMVVAFKVANASGTPIVNFSNFSGGGWCAALHYAGFTGTPTLIVSDTTAGEATSSSAVDSGTFTNTKNNELCVASMANLGNQALLTFTGWTRRIAGGTTSMLEQTGVASGSTINLAGGITNPDTWYASVVSFFDAPAGVVAPQCGRTIYILP